MIDLHLEALVLRERGGDAAWLKHIADEASVLLIVPALAAVHGLGTGRCSLQAIFGFNLLNGHVRARKLFCCAFWSECYTSEDICCCQHVTESGV